MTEIYSFTSFVSVRFGSVISQPKPNRNIGYRTPLTLTGNFAKCVSLSFMCSAQQQIKKQKNTSSRPSISNPASLLPCQNKIYANMKLQNNYQASVITTDTKVSVNAHQQTLSTETISASYLASNTLHSTALESTRKASRAPARPHPVPTRT